MLQNNVKLLERNVEEKINEALKYKEMGLLNDSDIGLLK